VLGDELRRRDAELDDLEFGSWRRCRSAVVEVTTATGLGVSAVDEPEGLWPVQYL